MVGSHNRSEELISMQKGVGTRLQGGDDRREERYEYVGEPLKHFSGVGEGGVEVSSKIDQCSKVL